MATWWHELASHFQRPWLLAALFVLPVLSLLVWRGDHRRQKALRQFGQGKQFHELELQRRKGWFLTGLLWNAGWSLLVLAAAGPQWGKDWEVSIAPGRDLILVLDVSRSMTAEQPSRIELARRLLVDLLTSIRQRGGHRLALVLFAGRAKVVCPLTQDYDHVADVLEQLDELRLDPELAPGPREASGTRIENGIFAALALIDRRYTSLTDVVLLSDGDDPAGDHNWNSGIIEASSRSVPLSVVGIGDAKQDSTIPGPDGPLRDSAGRPVVTRLEKEPLEKIARDTGGRYLEAGRTAFPLGTMYREQIATLPRRTDSIDALPTKKSHYRLFLVPALILLTFAWLRRE